MKKIKTLLMTSLFMVVTFIVSYASADSSVVAPQDFLAQVIQVVQQFGGLPMMLKIASVIMLIIASMKVSYINSMVWAKLGAAQVYVAPVLGLIAGILGLGSGGVPVSAALVFAYVSAGAGAVFLHEILDSVKAIPGIGPIYVTLIDLIEGALGGPAASAPAAPKS